LFNDDINIFNHSGRSSKNNAVTSDDIKTVPLVSLSHPFVERLVGTMRRDFVDHVLFWNTGDLERKLADFQAYYNDPECSWR
jgi:putative transposase